MKNNLKEQNFKREQLISKTLLKCIKGGIRCDKIHVGGGGRLIKKQIDTTISITSQIDLA